jgi:hypothetical protein
MDKRPPRIRTVAYQSTRNKFLIVSAVQAGERFPGRTRGRYCRPASAAAAGLRRFGCCLLPRRWFLRGTATIPLPRWIRGPALAIPLGLPDKRLDLFERPHARPNEAGPTYEPLDDGQPHRALAAPPRSTARIVGADHSGPLLPHREHSQPPHMGSNSIGHSGCCPVHVFGTVTRSMNRTPLHSWQCCACRCGKPAHAVHAVRMTVIASPYK